jgi:hypothetical protein
MSVFAAAQQGRFTLDAPVHICNRFWRPVARVADQFTFRLIESVLGGLALHADRHARVVAGHLPARC